ncbi:MAG: hypothetical protein MUF00_11810, partial [Gemmatimonadaceae bacterium]|jgi:hypothetical protein|nr:hypothetical protein [Gemmatimonadaceae bacterium]
MATRSLRSSWIRATVLGWIVGVPVIVLLVALAERFGQHRLNTPIGAGMGLTVGVFQSRVIRARLGGASPWFWSCVVGLASPFLATDIARAVGVDVPYSLYAAVICGGLVVGVWQGALLRSSLGRGTSWVAASVIGWALASGAVALADFFVRATSLRGVPGALVYLGLVALGGVLLAVSSGFVLVRLLTPQPTV